MEENIYLHFLKWVSRNEARIYLTDYNGLVNVASIFRSFFFNVPGFIDQHFV